MENVNYEELEGSLVYAENFSIVGKVIGCDYDLGVTIVSVDGEHYMACARGPSSPLWNPETMREERYKAGFDEIVRQIKRGWLDYRAIENTVGEDLSNNLRPLTSEDCTFAQ